MDRFELAPEPYAVSAEHVFRASPMELVQIYIPLDAARDAAGALGRLGCVHLRDLNAEDGEFQRKFAPELRWLDTVEQQCREIENSTHLEHCEPSYAEINAPLLTAAEVRDLAARIGQDAARVREMARAHSTLLVKLTALQEERHILLTSGKFFAKKERIDEEPLLNTYTDDGFEIDSEGESELLRSPEDPINQSDLRDSRGPRDPRDPRGLRDPRDSRYRDEDDAESVVDDFLAPELVHDSPLSANSIICGSIASSKVASLERLCYRATRGNVFFAAQPVEGEQKHVFVCYTHGSAMAQKMQQLAESMGSRVLSVGRIDRLARVRELNAQIAELQSVVNQTAHTLTLERDIVSQTLPTARAVMLKERLLYTNLNRFSSDDGRKGLLGEGWVPRAALTVVRECIAELSQQNGAAMVVHSIQTSRKPPTFHSTTKVTQAFQSMVDVYGIARCGEVNPGLPTVVTFPFMFAVMFGDCGHGFLLFLFALVLVLKERAMQHQPKGEILQMAFDGRYVLLLMGMFSVFTGFMYNDLFSKPMTLFKSSWTWPAGLSLGDSSDGSRGLVTATQHGTYPFGLDYAWHAAENALRFTNSYKMKLSVLLGFVHMTYSLMFQLVNYRYFNQTSDIYTNFIPSFIFMQSIFGYLSVCIVYKWTVDWNALGKTPPSLLNMLIKMFLSPTELEDQLYKGQKQVQLFLLFSALACVPWLLLAKPLHWRRKNKSAYSQLTQQLAAHSTPQTFAIDEYHESDEESSSFAVLDAMEPAEHDNESFGDVMVHQTIHTIEFCLNCVSHTASYLRLWALSLAHSQLSQVLWNMTLRNAFGPTGALGIIMTVVLFGAWFVITVLVLVCMEGTSAMLHALRLQWVESMSKHFEGDGYAFAPFSFAALAS